MMLFICVNKDMNNDIKKRIVKSLVWPVELYRCETWTMRKEEMDRLTAFEMWIWRRMEKISWTERKGNEEVIAMGHSSRGKMHMLEIIAKRKKAWVCHVVRH